MYRYELVRYSDDKKWADSDVQHDHVVAWASQKAGVKLHVPQGDDPVEFLLTRIEIGDERVKPLMFSLSSSRKSKMMGTIACEGSEWRVRVCWLETNALLIDMIVESDARAREVIDAEMQRFSISEREVYIEVRTK